MNRVDPIKDLADVKAIKKYLREKDEKYYILFITGINLGLNVCDILSMTIGDVKGKREYSIHQRGGKKITVAFNAELLSAYKEYCTNKDPDEALIPTRYNEYKAVSRVQVYNVIREAAERYRVPNIGTQSLRKTCGYHFYMQTKDIETLQIWFNHKHYLDTLHYIGVVSDVVKNATINFAI